MPDGVDALVEGDPCRSPVRVEAGKRPRRIVGRRDRVLREGVQDVGQHQFLMLLLVIEADFDQRGDRPSARPHRPLKEFHDGGVDMPAVGGDFVGAGAGQVAALVAGVPGSGADIIGIEQEGVVGMKRLVARDSVRRAGIARRTRWYGRGAISPGWRPASTGSADPPASGGRRGARSRCGPSDRLPPDPGRGCRNRRIMTGKGRQTAAAADAGFVTVSPIGERTLHRRMGSPTSVCPR